jgi:hypothetical protein
MQSSRSDTTESRQKGRPPTYTSFASTDTYLHLGFPILLCSPHRGCLCQQYFVLLWHCCHHSLLKPLSPVSQGHPSTTMITCFDTTFQNRSTSRLFTQSPDTIPEHELRACLPLTPTSHHLKGLEATIYSAAAHRAALPGPPIACGT